jgi:hypothetical protein
MTFARIGPNLRGVILADIAARLTLSVSTCQTTCKLMLDETDFLHILARHDQLQTKFGS